MRNLLKKVVLGILNGLARIRLKRLRLFVIGVTGSIGKTSAKEALYEVLKARYRVYRSDKSYNTEFGLPLAILEQSSGFSSPLRWIRVLLGALWSAIAGGRHMQILILEMGVDKPGDMMPLIRLARPQMAVFTNVKPVHLAEGQFKDPDDIFAEKRKLIDSLPEKGTAILNADDPYVSRLREEISCKKIFYGFADWADVRAFNVQHSFEGLRFAVSYKDEVVEGTFPLLGSFQVYILLAAVSAAITQGFTLSEAFEGLKNYTLPPGRMNPIPGIKDTLIIDSSYNASPEVVKEALKILGESAGRKIAVLGNMNELGDATEMKHREIGSVVPGHADILVTVGDNARLIGESAKEAGLPAESVHQFDDAGQAADFVRTIMARGDTILVKGSQNRVRLERLVKKLMRDPERARELLARQDEAWNHIQ